jgi:hypothetical protein
MVQLLLAERHRWRYLEFQKMDWHALERTEDPSEILFETPESSMNLEEFSLISQCHENVFSWLPVAKPKALRLYKCSIAPLTRITWWDGLTTLDLQDGQEHDFNAFVCTILSSLRSQLSHLSLSQIPFTEFDLGSGMEFPRLQSLKLNQVAYWWKFSAPNIVSLRLSPSQPAPPNTVVTYPQVTNLQYSAYYTPLSWETLSLPKLVSMRLESPKVGTPGVNLIWCKEDGTLSPAPPREITISGGYKDATRIGYKDMITSLIPHTNVTKLELVDLKLPVTFYKSFLKKASQDNVLCPRLCELVVNLSGISTKLDVTQYHEVFETLAQERRQSDSPLRRLYVTWPEILQDKPRDYML